MFWKKKKAEAAAVATELGSFVWDDSDGTWSCDVQKGDRNLFLSYEGNPLQTADLARFQQILADIEILSKLALESNTSEIEGYDHAEHEMELTAVSIDSSEGDEEFSLSFGFQKWPDGGLTVHFRGREITGSHIDD